MTFDDTDRARPVPVALIVATLLVIPWALIWWVVR